jgi:hypothetical protein
MAKTKISEWSATPANNTDIDGINIAEGCAPSGINDAIREMMAQVKDLYAGTSGDATAVAGGGTGATTASGARANLGVAIGTDVQAYDAQLSTLAGASADRATFLASEQGFGFRNRIINGDMRINQRAVTSMASGSEGYTLDRWIVANYFLSGAITVGQSTDAPAGFTNSLQVTNGTGESLAAADYGVVRQKIEGYNFADMAWGSASAKQISISFWVKSSVTGNYSVGLINSALNRANRTVFTINSANTWEQKTVTFAGDTSGTWVTNNGIGLYLDFVIVAGSNQYAAADTWTANSLEGVSGASATWVTSTGATFYITGVQLEAGSVASPFERRDYGRELMMAQRYYQSYAYDSKGVPTLVRITSGINEYDGSMPIFAMRASPTLTTTSTQVHKPGVRSESFTLGVYTTPTVIALDVSPATNDASSYVAFLRDGRVNLTAEL